MKEIPKQLTDVGKKLWSDPEYFEYALLNGGIMLLVFPLIIAFFAFWIHSERKLNNNNKKENEYENY